MKIANPQAIRRADLWILSLILGCMAQITVAGAAVRRSQTELNDKRSISSSSAGAMSGVTLQRTRAYAVKSPGEPKTIVWKSQKLFTLHRFTSFSGTMGTLDYFGWFPTYYGYSTPIVADNTVYFSLFVGDGYFFALDSSSGQERKTLKLKDTAVSPLAVAGDYLFMGTSDGIIRSMDLRTWAPKWQIAAKEFRFDVTAPVIADGILLIGGARRINQQNMRPDGTLHALDAMTGQQIWMVKLKGISTSAAVDNGTAYYGDDDSHLFAIDMKSGKQKWSIKTDGNIRTQVLSGDQIFFAAHNGNLYSADKHSGNLTWKAEKIPGVRTALALSNGLIYFGGGQNSIYGIDSNNGSEKWSFQTRKACSTPVVAGGVLCFVSGDRFLYAVDAETGVERWKFKCQNDVSLSPTITKDMIYLLDDDGYMFGIR